MPKANAIWTQAYEPEGLKHILTRFNAYNKDFDAEDYDHLNVREVMAVTEKAIQFRLLIGAIEQVHWFPQSVLKVDSGGEFYCRTWLLDKEGLR